MPATQNEINFSNPTKETGNYLIGRNLFILEILAQLGSAGLWVDFSFTKVSLVGFQIVFLFWVAWIILED